jgi:fibronectin type 3 domain-containing protein
MRNTAARPRPVLLVLCLLAAAPALAGDLFVKPNGSGTACVQSSPCSLATALARAVANDSIYLAAGVYTGTGPQVVLLDRTVSLLGGWSGAPAGAVVRDPVAHESVLDGENARRVVKIIAAGVTLDGLTIRRGNASGTGAECDDAADAACGGGVFVRADHVSITNNRVLDNTADASPAGGWRVGHGGGIMACCYFTNLTVTGNLIANNLGSTASAGEGGGIAVKYGTGVRLSDNRIIGNVATTGADVGWGGGVACTGWGSTSVIERNVFIGNRASARPGLDHGNSFFTWYHESHLRGNAMSSDAPGSAVYLGFFAGTLAGNTVRAGADSRVVEVVNGYGGGVSMVNNVVVGGAATEQVVHVVGYVEHPAVLLLEHDTIVGNGLSVGVLADEFGTATMTNNLVSGHATGLETQANGAIVAAHTLFWNNADDGIRGATPIDGDPRFVNAPGGDFHIGEGSAAIGAAVNAGVAADIDGEPRPGLGGIDIGADELAPRRFDFGTPGSPVAAGYAQVTHATASTAGLGFGWTHGTVASRDRGTANDDLRRDLCFATTANFGVALPNGRYRVTVTMGDAVAGHGQMAVHLENVWVATVSTAANEFKQLTFETAVEDEWLDLWLADGGGSDPNVVINALAIEPALPVLVDLGTAASPLAAGYARGTHATPYAPGAAFGWMGGIVQSRDRGTADPLTRDLAFSPRALLGAFLPNGLYDVAVTMGDAAGAHNMMGVSAQGSAFDPVSTVKNQFVTRRYRTAVADNRLELLLDDLEGPDVNSVLNAVEIRPPVVPRFDFGTPTSNVEPGWVRVSEKTRYADGLGYGWQFGTVTSRDRGTGTPLRQDLNVTREALFTADVLNGRYAVTITMGDAAAAHDQMWLALEGSQVATVSTAKGEFRVETFAVTVTDGTLDLAIEDWGGADLYAVINALEIR